MTEKAGGTKPLIFIFITVMIDTIGLGIIIPVLPQLITGLTTNTISIAAQYGGALMVVYALTHFFFAPVLGNLSDAFGRRPVLLMSLFALGVDYLPQKTAPRTLASSAPPLALALYWAPHLAACSLILGHARHSSSLRPWPLPI